MRLMFVLLLCVMSGLLPVQAEEAYPLSIELIKADIPADPNKLPDAALTDENGVIYQSFDDMPMIRDLHVPDWFEKTFLNLSDDLDNALAEGKKGILLYYTQTHCAYCEAMQETVFARPDIKAYLSKYFNVIPIDVWGKLETTDFDGTVSSEADLANRHKAYFTPTLMFYTENAQLILRLRGYYPPYTFRSALDFVIGDYHQQGSFSQYLNRVKAHKTPQASTLKNNPHFMSPPYLLKQSASHQQRPLMVIFEQSQCHACDIMHLELLNDPLVERRLAKMDIARLNLAADTPLVTPTGERTTSRAWAEKLGIFFTPSFLFFDESGAEILRIDSVMQRTRLNQVLRFILHKGYLETPNFDRWISRKLGVEAE